MARPGNPFTHFLSTTPCVLYGPGRLQSRWGGEGGRQRGPTPYERKENALGKGRKISCTHLSAHTRYSKGLPPPKRQEKENVSWVTSLVPTMFWGGMSDINLVIQTVGRDPLRSPVPPVYTAEKQHRGTSILCAAEFRYA